MNDTPRRVQKKFTIPAEELRLAEEYAKLDHRTMSELICEALKQMRHRYPHKDNTAIQTLKELSQRVQELEKKLASMRGNPGVVLFADNQGESPVRVHAGTLQGK